jgi:peptide/nickel transport system ATP-binding protein
VTPADAAARTPLLRVENLGVHLRTERGDLRVVDGVSFSVERGMTLGIVGESGCGKTLVCRSLIGLLPGCAVVDEDARVHFQGRDLLRLPEQALNRVRAADIAMIFQDPLSALNPVMSVGRQIAETLVHHRRMKPKKARLRAVELLRSVGVSSPELRVDQYPHQISGGMRQRAAIAIALSCEPRVLIADEPTTALDVTVQEAILDLLVGLQAEREMGMILVTHDLAVAAGCARSVAVMYAGRIVERISAAKLFAEMRMPYTRALIDAIPKMDRPPHTPLRSIEGQPPDPAADIRGCAFAPRCDRAAEKCRHQTPPLRSEGDPHHWFACWNPIRGGAP